MPDEQFKVDLILDATNVDKGIEQTNKKLVQFSKESSERSKAKLRISIANFQSQLEKARVELRKFKKEGDKASELQARLRIQGLQQNVSNAKKQLKAISAEADKTKKSFFSLNTITKDLIKGFGGLYIIRQVVGFFKSAKEEAIKFESAFAGVRKTTEATEREFKAIEKGLISLSKVIPLTASELAGIAETAGQLGVAKEDILAFTETIAKIGATTNLSEQEASTAFARIANIFQEPIANVENLASAVVDLGNNFATTEKEIIEFATRIAGAGKIAGLSTSDIVAIGTAFTSVGVQAEAGGTATQKVLFAINDAVSGGGKELNKFAQLTGQTTEGFAKRWREEPAKAFDDFVKGLATAGDKGAQVLEELVAGDQRLARAFLSVASAGDLLTRALDKSSQAYVANTALVAEANKRFETSESKLRIQAQRWDELKRIIGSFIVKVLIPLITFFVDLSEDLVTGSKNLGNFATAIKALTALLTAMIAVKVVAFFVAMATAIGTAGGAVAVLTAQITALKIAILSTPLTLVITASIIGASVVIQKIKQIQRAIGVANDAIQGNSDNAKKSGEESKKVIQKLIQENGRLEKSTDKQAKNQLKNNKELIKLENLRLKESLDNQTKASLLQEKNNLINVRGFKKARREEVESELKAIDERLSANRKQSLEIVRGFDDESAKKLETLRGFNKTVEKEAPKLPSLLPKGGALKKGSEEAKDALKGYEKAIGDADKATEKLAKNTEDYYDDIIEKIQDAKNEQVKLKKELAEFEGVEQEEFVRATAERQVELVEEEKKIREELAEEATKAEGDQEKFNDLNEELNAILAERKEIQAFIDTGEGVGDFQAELDRATERATASSFGLAKLDLEERLELKRQEIQAEIEKQQKILDIQEKFNELQTAVGAEADEKRIKLTELVEGADTLEPEERRQALLDLGFAELSAEQEIELLKQAERFKALEVERKDVENQQQQILDTKKEYFALAEEAHKTSTDAMIAETDALIARINTAIQAQLRLRELGGSAVEVGSGSTTEINVTNNNANDVDAQSAVNSLINKINQ